MPSRRSLALGLVVVGVAGLLPALAQGQFIGISTQVCGSSCAIRVSSPGPVTFYINIDLEGTAACYAGASFLIEGVPESWFLNAGPNSCNSIPCDPGGCHSPFTPPGIDLNLGECPAAECTWILQVQGFAAVVPPPNTILRVVARNPPIPGFDCPVIALCDGTYLCARGGTAIINPSGDCQVAVEAQTWSRIKRFFE